MGDKTTLSVDPSTLERFKDVKAELDDQQSAPDHTADSFLNALLDTWEAADDGYYNTEWNTDALEELLERTADAEFVPLEEVGDVDTNADAEDLARQFARELDYAELAKQVADELEERMR